MTNPSIKTETTEESTTAATNAEEIALCLEPDITNAAVDRTTANTLKAKETDACDPQMTNPSIKTDITEENTTAATHAEKIALYLGPDTADAAVDRTTANALEPKATDACDPQMTKASMKTNPTEENTSSSPHAEEIADPLEPDTADVSVDRTANALEAMSVHVIDLMLPGGQIKKGINPLEGAKLWMDQFYPNLDSRSVILRADYKMPIPMLVGAHENLLVKQITELESKNKDDAKYLKDMEICMKGQTTEITTTDWFVILLEMTKPKVIISNFERRWFYSMMFSPASGQSQEKNQEIDNVIILGEYSTVVMLEIKSSKSSKFDPAKPSSMAEPLNRKNEI